MIKFLQPQSSCTTFDELRFEMYSIKSLTSRSHSTQRCYYLIRQCISLLKDIPYMDPSDYGWSDNHGYFLPEKQLLPLPAYFLIRCCYKTKCSGRYSCVKMAPRVQSSASTKQIVKTLSEMIFVDNSSSF